METSIWWLFDGPWIGTPGASSLGRHRTKPPCTLCRTNFAISPLGSPVVSGHSFGRLGIVVFHSVTWEFPTKKGTDCHLENNGCAIWMIFERGCTRRMKTSVHIRSHIFWKLFECSSSHQCRVFRSTIIYPNENSGNPSYPTWLVADVKFSEYPAWDRATWLFYIFWIAWKQPVGDTQWYTTRSPYQNIERTLCDSVLATYLILYRLVVFYSIS